jgi:23S rRNA pseudouridine1911/1915/1917 synthase
MENMIVVSEQDSGIRLDKFIVKHLVERTRGEIIKMIKAQSITVIGRDVKPSYKLKTNDEIIIGEYEEKSKEIKGNKNIVIDIIENKENFVIVNKQIGLQVHPSHREREKTLVNALLAYFPEIKNVGDDEERPGIVHRLDKDTTGLIVVAKNQETFLQLKEKFKKREIQKTYFALVFGNFEEKKGLINAPIARATSYTKQKIAFGKYKGDSKDAQTEFEVISQYYISNELQISLVKIMPKTGRTHQIRVHMSHIGHPLICDVRYYTKNEKKISLDCLREYNPETFYLHAKELTFNLNNEEYDFKVDLPDRFSAVVNYLRAFEI